MKWPLEYPVTSLAAGRSWERVVGWLWCACLNVSVWLWLIYLTVRVSACAWRASK